MPARHTPAAAAPRLDATLDFMRLLWNIEHHLQSTSKLMGARLGITGPQRLVLRVVARHPDISAKAVADVLRLHPSTITGILQRLARKDLLVRTQDPRDTRRVRLRVRPAARRYTRRTAGTVEHAVERVLTRMPTSSVHTAARVLGAIAASLEVDGGRS